MKIYRTLWLVGSVALIAVGAIGASLKSPVAMTFLFVYFGALGMLLAASSPRAMKKCRRWLGMARRPRRSATTRRPYANARPHNALPSQPDLSRLTDEQLCQLWRASYLALLHSAGDQTAETVVQRQRYLDEFERRNRTGFAIWLASGPLASASPLPYLVGVPTINWDDLTREQD